MTSQLQSFVMARYPLTGNRVSLSAKGKGDALERGNYHGLKLTEQVLKVLVRIVVSIDDSQFCFIPGRGTTDAIFVVQAVAREISSCQQETLHGFHRPGEGI